MKLNFIKPTFIFAVVGLLIPSFSALGLLELQILLSKFGIECSAAWKVIWKTTTILALVLPFLFYGQITTLKGDKLRTLKIRLTLFNLFEYIFIQSSLTPLFTDGQTLCYARDGQNGLELVLTAWLALPILIVISFIFSKTISLTEIQIKE